MDSVRVGVVVIVDCGAVTAAGIEREERTMSTYTARLLLL
jgi:hypothetical protein